MIVQVQSSWFPLADRNPQTFVDIPHAKPEDFKTATERVFRGANAASSVEIHSSAATVMYGVVRAQNYTVLLRRE